MAFPFLWDLPFARLPLRFDLARRRLEMLPARLNLLRARLMRRLFGLRNFLNFLPLLLHRSRFL